MKLKFIKNSIITFVLLTLLSCGTRHIVPFTGRKQRIAEGAFNDVSLIQSIKPIYKQEIITYGDSENENKTQMVKNVSYRLIKAAETYLQEHGYSNEINNYEWEVHLIKSPEVNAVCYPGGKILVYEAILPVTYTEAGLAAVLGHEIGHALARHTAERMTKGAKKVMWQQIGKFALNTVGQVTGANLDEVNDAADATIELSNQVMQYVELKYNRKHEHEADYIGMMLMAMAGYDPHEAPKVWQRMTEQFGDFTNRILSTHPSNAKRKRWMEEKWMGEAMNYYNRYKLIEQQNKNNQKKANSSKKQQGQSLPAKKVIEGGQSASNKNTSINKQRKQQKTTLIKHRNNRKKQIVNKKK